MAVLGISDQSAGTAGVVLLLLLGQLQCATNALS